MPERDISSACDTGLPLAALHQRTVALQLALVGCEQLLRGLAIFEQDPELGSILRVKFPADVGCEFVICNDSWDGQIIPGDEFGCDFLIRLT